MNRRALFCTVLAFVTNAAADSGPLAALDTGLRPTVLDPGAAPPRWSLRERMAHYNVPGVAVAVLRDGLVVQLVGVRRDGLVV